MANRGRKKRALSYLLNYDTNLIVAVIFLIVFGLIMLYSASYYTASMRQSFNYDPAFFLKSQLKYSIIGLILMLVVANINYHNWRYFAVLGLIGSAVLILLLLVPGLAITNAVRDSIGGDLLAGIIRAIEACLVAVAIALGAGVTMSIWLTLMGGA